MAGLIIPLLHLFQIPINYDIIFSSLYYLLVFIVPTTIALIAYYRIRNKTKKLQSTMKAVKQKAIPPKSLKPSKEGIVALQAKLGVFKKVVCLIAIPMGETYVVVKKFKANVMAEQFRWKNFTFRINMDKIAFVNKGHPHLLYDYRYMDPINMTHKPDTRQSTTAFTKLFHRNLVAQALAALKLQAGLIWGQIIMGILIGGAIGYVLGILFPTTALIQPQQPPQTPPPTVITGPTIPGGAP